MLQNSLISLNEQGQGCQVPPLDLYKGAMEVKVSDESPALAVGGDSDGSEVSDVVDGRKVKRFFIRCREGIWIAQMRGYVVRTFVLTESDYAIGMNLSWSKAVNKFGVKLRYDYGRDIGLLWVEHLQGEKVRRNRHIVQWGSAKLNLDDLNSYWLKVYGSLLTWRKRRRGGMIVGSAEKCARYLSKYVSGEGFVRARFSNNWVFQGWFEYGKWSKKCYGEYPCLDELALLAGMSPVERLGVSRYREWYETKQGKLKSVIADRMMGKSAEEVEWESEYRKRRHSSRPMRIN